MAKTDNMEGKSPEAEAFAEKPKPDHEKDPNVQARKRAAKRSANRNSGKPVDETPAEATADDMPTGDEGEGEGDGGIVAEAEKELAESKAEGAENETPAEQAEGAATGEETPAPAEEPKAEETPAEEPKAEEAPAEETPAPVEEPKAEAEESEEGPAEYQAPEGESHEDLINRYHEAIAYGDIQQANELYKQLQDHRYNENKFRAHKEALDEADAREHLAVAKELAAKHPELAEDGVAANKVLALAEVYRQEGLKAAAALRQACADLYPEQPASTSGSEVPPAATEEAATAAPAEEPAAEAPGASPSGEEAGGLIPDMEERNLKKRAIAEVPTASARNEPAPPPAKPTRSSAIVDMKRARGQM